jgi:hypothetical protein
MSFVASLKNLLEGMEYGFKHSAAEFTNAAEVAGMVFSRCKEMRLRVVETILNWSTATAIEEITYFSVLGLFERLGLTSDPALDIYVLRNAHTWEKSYKDAISTLVTPRYSTPRYSTSEQRELIATRGSFAAYMLLYLANMGLGLNQNSSAWHKERYNDILENYWKTLSCSSLESQLHLFAGMFPAEKVNAWLDFLDVSKDTVWTPGAIGTKAGGNNEDLYYNGPKKAIGDMIAEYRRTISKLQYDVVDNAEANMLMREKLMEVLAKQD